MGTRKNLLKLFSQDVEYNYHIVSTTEPNGNLIYIIKNGLELNTDSLEFSNLKIAEELIKDNEIKIERFAPAIYFNDDSDIEELKTKLNVIFSENSEFSTFVDSIKSEYRILELNDSLLYKKDPAEYEEARKKEHAEKQKELWGQYTKQIEEQEKSRKSALLAYNNDFMKLLKDYLESIIEYEKRDFNFSSELDKIVSGLINPETWIKINDKPFMCNISLISMQKDNIDVYLTDNNNYSYSAKLRFKDTVLETENIVKIEIGDDKPNILSDYDSLILLYDIDTKLIVDWDLKNETDRFNYIIDYLSPIFKDKIDKAQKERIDEYKSIKNGDSTNLLNEEEKIDTQETEEFENIS